MSFHEPNSPIQEKSMESSSMEHSGHSNEGGNSQSPPPFQLKATGGMPQNLVDGFASSTGHDLSDVNVHKNSAKPADVGAHAYAQGNDIHLGPGQEKHLAHEAGHIVQQREGRVQANTSVNGMAVNDDKGLESEADKLGDSALQAKMMPGDSSANLKKSGGGGAAQMKVIQRHIKGKGKVKQGEFEIDMEKKEAPPETKAGEKGTVKFTPNEKSPDTNEIKLVQIVKTNDMTKTPPADYNWTGSEADRMKVQTSAETDDYSTVKGDTLEKISTSKTNGHIRPQDLYELNKATLTSADINKEIKEGTKIKLPKVEGGYFIDHAAGSSTAAPRTSGTDANVPLDYRSYWPNAGSSQHGHKKGKADIAESSLWDFPGGGSGFDITFDFETVARSYDKGFDYGTMHWGFRLNKGKVQNEYQHVEEGTSGTFSSAVKEFNEHYKNHHVVVEGETLWEIAELYLGSGSKWTEIQKANKLKDSSVRKGQKLIIPTVTKT